MSSLAIALKEYVGKEVFVFLGLRDSNGRMGRVVDVGDDYLELEATNQQTYYIPFSAVLAISPKEDSPA